MAIPQLRPIILRGTGLTALMARTLLKYMGLMTFPVCTGEKCGLSVFTWAAAVLESTILKLPLRYK